MGRKSGDHGPKAAVVVRHARLESVLSEELAALLRDEVRDPSLDRARLGSVEVASNLSSVRARLWLPPGADLERAAKAADRVTPYLRARLVEAVELKYAPQLRLALAHGDAADFEELVSSELGPLEHTSEDDA